MATHSVESPWTEEPGGLQSMGHKESDTTEPLEDFQVSFLKFESFENTSEVASSQR